MSCHVGKGSKDAVEKGLVQLTCGLLGHGSFSYEYSLLSPALGDCIPYDNNAASRTGMSNV
jgi:hypothetical protein